MSNETAFAHRNVRASSFHTPAVFKAPDVGYPSAEVADFARTQTADNDGAALSAQFPVDTATGWHGYVEWEQFPERAKAAAVVLDSKTFTPVPEFQLVPLPDTNPILIGNRWKEYHLALGPSLENVPQESFEIAKIEKDPSMLTVLDFPLNCEPMRADLMKSHITPNEFFFVRNHGGIPTIADEDYSFTIGGLIGNPGKMTLAELKDEKTFPQIEMTVTLQCCGTRRVEQIAAYAGEGDELLSAPWAEGAIGTAVWKGVSLKKVLKHFGRVRDENCHIEFLGADTYFKKNEVFNYAVSVPYKKVKISEVMLAYEMNGAPLPKCNGGPLRAIVCGYIGARSCKWLTRINILDAPSMGPVQAKEYLYFNHQIGKHNVSFSKGFSIQNMPVASAILFPSVNAVEVHDGFVDVSGWAYSGGGNWVERVEVSSDGGFVWYEVPNENLSPKLYHAMRLWNIKLPVAAEGWLELVVRAWDSSCNTQPTLVRSAWNWTLHVTSHCHRVKFYSVNKSHPATAARLAQFEKYGDSIDPITRPVDTFSLESETDYLAALAIKGPREPLI